MNRRRFLSTTFRFSLALLGMGFVRSASEARAAGPPAPAGRAFSETLTRLLDRSPFVYISPLLADGRESRCHAELWYAWLDGSVVVTVSRDRWKARAIASGRDRARIWVGDHGIWRGFLWNNESFRSAPTFDARGEVVEDGPLLEALLARYETKYPDEIADWRDRMRNGHADGSRVLVRYTPAG